MRIHPYDPKFPLLFNKEKTKISKTLKTNDIHHIGSTAVVGLGGKGVIDILIGARSWDEARIFITKLEKIGYKLKHIKGERSFLQNGVKKESELNDFHLHIVKHGCRAYRDFLAFRDFLRNNPKEIKRYFDLKLKWVHVANNQRQEYTKLKEKYIRTILKQHPD